MFMASWLFCQEDFPYDYCSIGTKNAREIWILSFPPAHQFHWNSDFIEGLCNYIYQDLAPLLILSWLNHSIEWWEPHLDSFVAAPTLVLASNLNSKFYIYLCPWKRNTIKSTWNTSQLIMIIQLNDEKDIWILSLPPPHWWARPPLSPFTHPPGQPLLWKFIKE